jgi:RHS repeat-associated protein
MAIGQSRYKTSDVQKFNIQATGTANRAFFIGLFDYDANGNMINITYPIFAQNMANGNRTYTFTNTGTKTHMTYGFYLYTHTPSPNNLANRFFTLENIEVTFTGNIQLTECLPVGTDLAEYRFGFNGKEKDDEVKGRGVQYDYGFRINDSRLGKFLSVDPLTSSYPWYTPFQFAGNKPIIASDLDGLEEFIRTDYFDANGNLYKTYIAMVSTLGANQNSQTVHHSSVTETAPGSGNFVKNYQGTTLGTTAGNNAFQSPNPQVPANVNVDNNIRRNALKTDLAGNPRMLPLPTPIPITIGPFAGLNATQGALTPSTFNVGYVHNLYNDAGVFMGFQLDINNNNIKLMGGSESTYTARNFSATYSPAIPLNDNRINFAENAVPSLNLRFTPLTPTPIEPINGTPIPIGTNNFKLGKRGDNTINQPVILNP